jgi:hypothetical protein
MRHKSSVAVGDVVIRANDAGTTPAFVLRIEPGPDQYGCATLAALAELAIAYADHAGVDVWLAGVRDTVTAIAHCRGPARRPVPPTRPLPARVAVLSAPSVAIGVVEPLGGPYTTQLLATRARLAARQAS